VRGAGAEIRQDPAQFNPCITVMETIKMADYGYVWLYGCMPKSVSVGLGCGLGYIRRLAL